MEHQTNGIFKSALGPERVASRVVGAEYSVRGELDILAAELESKLANGEDLGFDRVIYCNIANPQGLAQPPVTYLREVMALIQCPWLLEDPATLEHLSQVYSPDSIERARSISSQMVSIGAYSPAKGFPFVRKHVAEFLAARDGFPADPEHIFMADGASEAIRRSMSCLVDGPKCGVLLPFPQYPLYSASVNILGGTIINYELVEEENWALDMDGIELAVENARSKGIDVKLFCLINPGNPIGYHYTKDTLSQIAQFCDREHITILSDEVFQLNIHTDTPFISMKKIVCELGLSVPLISTHSTSKGLIGESGKRAGFLECHNVSQLLMDQLYKIASLGLCPNVDGQIMTDLMVKQPQPGDHSYGLYMKQTGYVRDSLKRRIRSLQQQMSALTGVSCTEPEGSFYLYPHIRLPPSFIEEAKSQGYKPDTLYCLKMLKNTGICTLPGNGFGQKMGTFHIRITCLPAEEIFPAFLKRLTDFHQTLMQQYIE